MALRKKKDDNKLEELSFEEAIKSLTEMVSQIETGQISLAESLEKYEKGMSMIRHCRRILLEAEKRIQEISDDERQCPPAGQTEAQTEEEQEEQTEQEKESANGDESLF